MRNSPSKVYSGVKSKINMGSTKKINTKEFL